jgi:hypothetical protein
MSSRYLSVKTVMNQETVAVVRRHRVTQLLQRPLGRRMSGHGGMQDTVRGLFHHDKHIQEAKSGGDHHAEVARDDHLRMSADKGPPALRREAVRPTAVQTPGEILPYGTWRHLQAQLQQEFVGDPLLAPRRVVPSHATDEPSQCYRDRWPSRLRFPPPAQPEPLAVPADQRHRLHDGQCLPPIEPAGEPGHRNPGGIGCSPRFGIALLIQCQLLPQKEVLGREGRTGAQAQEQEAHGINKEYQQRAYLVS